MSAVEVKTIGLRPDAFPGGVIAEMDRLSESGIGKRTRHVESAAKRDDVQTGPEPLRKGWLAIQMQDVPMEFKSWPSWMQREAIRQTGPEPLDDVGE